MFMQFCDLERLRNNGAREELKRLCEHGYISAEDGARVRIREIEKFTRSTLFSEMLSAKKIYRELRFNVRLPASEFTADEEKKLAYKDREILVQGVIDCIIERADGSIALYDYKTDRLTREELCDPSLAEIKLREKHKMQLELYSMAVERLFSKAPEVLAVYSLALGDSVKIR